MIKWTTEVVSLIASAAMATCFSLYIWQFFAGRRKDKIREAEHLAWRKQMDEEHQKFRERMLGLERPPPQPPSEN